MTDITPTNEQAGAIKSIVAWYGDASAAQEYYMAGFAGVGKSTIAELAIQEIMDKYGIEDVRTAAYTGKAAHVLRRKGIEDATTIHSLIYIPKVKKGEALRFVKLIEGGAHDADLIVLDECSMVDEKMAEDLRSFNKKILVMGDPGQLPPVKGQGAFTNRKPDVFLQEIHRQAAGSPIIELATLVRQGKSLPRNYSRDGVQVRMLTKDTQQLVYAENTQPICGLNRVRYVYSQRIRKMHGFEGHKPMVGERLICCRNNQSMGLFNGAMGTLSYIEDIRSYGDAPAYEFSVKMEDFEEPHEGLPVDPHLFKNHFNGGKSEKIEVPKKGERLDEFDWGYILTAHKAQGSQFPSVTVVDDSMCFGENSAKWLYTSITRAETDLTVLLRG